MSKKVFQLSLFLVSVLCLEGAVKPVGATPLCGDMSANCEARKCEDALTEVRSDLVRGVLSEHCTWKRCAALVTIAKDYGVCRAIP